MITNYLYLDSVVTIKSFMLKRKYTLLKVSGKDFFEIDKIAHDFCQKNNMKLAGGSLSYEPTYKGDLVMIIDIEDKNWKSKYKNELNKIIAEVI